MGRFKRETKSNVNAKKKPTAKRSPPAFVDSAFRKLFNNSIASVQYALVRCSLKCYCEKKNTSVIGAQMER